MATLDASRAFSKIFDMADPELVPFHAPIAGGTATTATWKSLYDAAISAGFPGERATLTATGQNFTYDGTGMLIGGELLSLNFALGETGVIDTSVVFTSDVPLAVAGMLFDGDLVAESQAFWAALLSGDDVIKAPQQRNIGMTGDFYQVASALFTRPVLTGGNDRLSVRFDRADGVTLPGEATTNGESPYSGLVGDSFLVQGLRLVNLVFSATLVGGDDLISLSGFAGLDATGDAHTANGYGRVTGGDDRIINQAEGDPLLFDREPMWLAGDVHRSYEFSTIDGGRDSIVGSDFAFYSDIVSGDVMFCGAIATASGGTINSGADKIEGRSGQDLLAGDVYESFGGVIRGGNDHLRGGEDSDLIAGDVLRAAGAMAITGGNDILHGDNGNDRMAGDLLTAGAIAAGDAVTGGNDVLYGGDGNDVIHGDLFFTGGLFGSVVGGDDRLDGGLGDDVLNGQDGSDTVMFSGLALAVVVDLAAGTATGQGTDRISGIENIIGSSRSDVLKGDIGTNQIIGGPGNDQVIGRDGNDTLSGGNGNDQIIGGRGADELTGSAGTDRFVFLRTPAGADVIDRIVDFQDGTDRLDLRDFGFAGFAAVRALAADTPGGLRLDLPGEEVVRIIGLTKAAFDAGDVLL